MSVLFNSLWDANMCCSGFGVKRQPQGKWGFGMTDGPRDFVASEALPRVCSDNRLFKSVE